MPSKTRASAPGGRVVVGTFHVPLTVFNHVHFDLQRTAQRSVPATISRGRHSGVCLLPCAVLIQGLDPRPDVVTMVVVGAARIHVLVDHTRFVDVDPSTYL